MLKTLRITSLIALVLAVCGVLLIVVFGLRGDADIKGYLQSPGVIKQFEEKSKEADKDAPESPLVTQAHEFALRINPPPPPPQQPASVRREAKPVEQQPVQPQLQPQSARSFSTNFDLLATVLCEADPSRSMVLLKQASGKEEWFWQSETIGHFKIDEVRNGSVIFSQDGRNPQEKFVPAKPQAQSLLKADVTTSARPDRPGSINILSDAASTRPQTDDRSTAVTRPNLSRAATTAGTTASRRIQRVRTVPRSPAPIEQKASIESNIDSIREIMNREEGSSNEAQRKKENEAWTKLLGALQSEKQNLQSRLETLDEHDKNAGSKNEEKEEEQSESDVQKNDPNQK